MKTDILVSVVIPIYNAEKYLLQALTSIFNQTYKNIEIICIDDGSTDNSYNILINAAINENRLKVLHNKKNYGIVYSLNKGIQESNGNIIARMDADDISLGNRIEIQLNHLTSSEFDIIGSPVIYIDENGNEYGKSSTYTDSQIKKYSKYKSMLPHPTWMLYRYVYEKLGFYREIAPVEDYDLLLRALHGKFHVGMMSIPLLKYRSPQKYGGTPLTNGLVQRKMFNYALAISKGKAEYSIMDVVRIKNSSYLSNKLFYLSQLSYAASMRKRHQRKYLYAFLLVCLAIILSPYQAQFFFRAAIVKILHLSTNIFRDSG